MSKLNLTTWAEQEKELLEKGLITEEEIRESELRVALMSEIINARKELNITHGEDSCCCFYRSVKGLKSG